MSPNDTQLDDLRTATGIPDLGAMTDEQFAKVVEKAGRGDLSLEQLTMLTQVVPRFLPLLETAVVEQIAALKKVAKGAAASQKQALEAVGQTLDSLQQTLHVLAQHAQSDDARIEVGKIVPELGKMGLELAKIVQQMNTENNSFWWRIGRGVLIALGIISLAALTAAAAAAAVVLKGMAEQAAQAGKRGETRGKFGGA
jgi:hypothetical protein